MSSESNAKKQRGKYVIKSSNVVIEKTFNEAFEDFIEEKVAQNRAESTIRNYKQSIEYFKEFNDFDDTTLIKDVDKEMVYSFIGYKKAENISPASINHYLRDIRTFLYWCMEEPREYLKYYRIKEGSAQEEKPKMLSEEDLAKLLNKPSGRSTSDFTEWRCYAIVSWILATGNRTGTVRGVRIGDVDFKKKEITLAHTKNKKAQGIPLSDSLRQVLVEYTRLYRANADSTDYLFPTVRNEALTYNALRLAHTRYCKDREVNDTALHHLRHTFAYNYIKSGGDVVRLQKILGHNNISITRRYVNLMIEDIKEDYEDHSMLDMMKKKAKRTKLITSSLD